MVDAVVVEKEIEEDVLVVMDWQRHLDDVAGELPDAISRPVELPPEMHFNDATYDDLFAVIAAVKDIHEPYRRGMHLIDKKGLALDHADLDRYRKLELYGFSQLQEVIDLLENEGPNVERMQEQDLGLLATGVIPLSTPDDEATTAAIARRQILSLCWELTSEMADALHTTLQTAQCEALELRLTA